MSFNHYSGGCAPLPNWVDCPSPIKQRFPEEHVSEDSGMEDFRLPMHRSMCRSRSWSMCSTISGHSFCSYAGKSKSVQLDDTLWENQTNSVPKNASYDDNEQSALLKNTCEIEHRLQKLESKTAEQCRDKARLDSVLASLQSDVATFTHAKNLLQQRLSMYEAAQDKKFRVLQEQNMAYQQQIQEDLSHLEEKLSLGAGSEESLAHLQQEHENMIKLLTSGYSADMAGFKNRVTVLEKQIRTELTRFEDEMRRWASQLMIADWKHQREDKACEPRQENMESKKMLERNGHDHVAELETLHSRFENEKHELAQRLESHYENLLHSVRVQQDNELRQFEIRMSTAEAEFLKEKSAMQKNHSETVRELQNELICLKKRIHETHKGTHTEESFVKLREDFEDTKLHFSFQLKAKDEEIENLQAQVVESYDQVLHFQKKMKKLNQGKHQELEEQERHLKSVEDELHDMKREFNRLEDEYHRVQNTIDEKDAELSKLRLQLNEVYYHT